GAWDGCSAHIGRKGRTARRERRLVSAWSSRGLGYQLGRGAMTKGCGPDWSLTISPIRYVPTDDTNRVRSQTGDIRTSRPPLRPSPRPRPRPRPGPRPPGAEPSGSHPDARRYHAESVVELAARCARVVSPHRPPPVGIDAPQRGRVPASGGARSPGGAIAGPAVS